MAAGILLDLDLQLGQIGWQSRIGVHGHSQSLYVRLAFQCSAQHRNKGLAIACVQRMSAAQRSVAISYFPLPKNALIES